MFNLKAHVTDLAEAPHDVPSAYHVLLNDGPEPLRPLLSASLVVHEAHFGLLQTLGIHCFVVVVSPVDALEVTTNMSKIE